VTLPQGYTFIPGAAGPQLATFVAPPGGQTALASTGVPNVAFGSCSPSTQLKSFLAAQGYSETEPSVGGTFTGVPVSLNGNQLQQTPNLTLSAGAQYTFDVGGGYTLVPRADYYWQSHMWGRIFHDPADLIKNWDVANALLTFNAPEGAWYVGAYVKNVFNKTYVTGEYLTSSSSGLYTNAFLGDPRTFGLQAGIHF
jgi:outer membrane receptor protein involved in Fe transport